MENDERELRERRRLIEHCDYFFRPSASFYAELEQAIELAAAGRERETISFGGDVVQVVDLIEEYKLAEFVERARNPEDKLRGGFGSEAPLPGFEPRFPD